MNTKIDITEPWLLLDGIWHEPSEFRVPNYKEAHLVGDELKVARLKTTARSLVYQPLHPPVPAGYHIGAKPGDAPIPLPPAAEALSEGNWVLAITRDSQEGHWYIFADAPEATEDAEALSVMEEADAWVTRAAELLVLAERGELDMDETLEVYDHQEKSKRVLSKLRGSVAKGRGGHSGN